ncbi:MAG: transposase [Clostridia bacterium]|nr:transposase [Clostridia bacterium]
MPEVRRHGGCESKYNALLSENSLLFTVDLVKEQLRAAFAETSEFAMSERVMDIIDTCNATGNAHFQWFARLLETHMIGIIAHATYRISSGKIEGINNKIKTLRRQVYGIPDDEYFFLKVVDASYRPYVRNPKSHMFSH